MNDIEKIIRIAHTLGAEKEIVQGGGGNLSLKISEKQMIIKSSGCTFNEISKYSGLAFVDLKTIIDYYNHLIVKPNYDTAIYADKVLSHAQLFIHKPSMETGFHAFLDKAVIHTHPIVLNSIVCAKEGKKHIDELFGKDYAWIPYVTPGHKLAKKIYDELKNYREMPKIIILQNHGLIVSEKDLEDAFELHKSVIEKTKNYLKDKKILLEQWPNVQWYNLQGLWQSYNTFVEKFIKDSEKAKSFVAKHCFPDSVVFLSQAKIVNSIDEALNDKHPVAVLPEKGFIYNSSLKKAKEFDEIVTAYAMILKYSSKFGATNFLTVAEMEDILGLDAEKYRQNLKY